MKTVKVTFRNRKNKIKVNGKAPIYLRITVDNVRSEISIKKEISPDRWCSQKQRVIGNSREAKIINNYLDHLQRVVLEYETQLIKEGKPVSAAAIKERVLGKDKVEISLVDYFEAHNQKMKELIGNGYANNTYKRYRTCFKHVKNFLKRNDQDENINLSQMDLAFIQDFEHYLKTKKNPCNHNSALKYISHLQKVYNTAIDRDLTSSNPFSRYNAKYETKDPEYLNRVELAAIEEKEISIDRVDRVRDVFLFCCYTGLAYVDVEKLKKDDVVKDHDGEFWLMVHRQKTNEPSNILLLDTPLSIIDKYDDDPETEGGNLLPVISNQKTNAYLKEIAGLCGIKKSITFHMSRHTFATTVALENGVPMETVQKVLGHKDIRSTKMYARVTRSKIGRDMKKLRAVF